MVEAGFIYTWSDSNQDCDTACEFHESTCDVSAINAINSQDEMEQYLSILIDEWPDKHSGATLTTANDDYGSALNLPRF